MLQRVPVYRLVPGQRVAEDVRRAGGVLILKEGTILTADSILRLEEQDVREVAIGPAAQAEAPTESAIRSAGLQALEQRLSLAGKDPFLDLMREAYLQASAGTESS
ncbi:MAG: hypothetical protein H7A21_05895 [Spirochaetales bacterium]|nr:hypothetical protein [Leptospiraceae bacterium]MCP5480942.1 hypothetical protein [Spirochaetales bacterium]MCP5485322.1 hypothetical protein [Spirochaetales bacterium]